MKIAITLILFLANFSSAFQRYETDSIEAMKTVVSRKEKEVGAKNILVVYDFDNTLMAMNQDLGSDHWYNWQAELIGNKKSKQAVSENRDDFFMLNYKLLALSQMHQVESKTPSIVREIQDLKIKSIILTSRGPNYRNDTEIELERMGVSFKNSAIGPEGGYPSTFLPIDIESPRSVSYMDGIFMGSGQNKGKLLRSLLKKTNSDFKVIVFVDDSLKNIENMEKEFGESTELYTFYYTHEEPRVKSFDSNKKKSVSRQWQKLKTVLEEIFPIHNK